MRVSAFFWKTLHLWGAGLLSVSVAQAEVRVFVQDTGGVAYLAYQCTAGESVRAFALDVSVDRGQILRVSDFFRGVSVPGSSGYGIFPASMRDHLRNGGSVTNFAWTAEDYTPLAVVDDSPDTLPGLGSSGVTLELGALWDPKLSTAAPSSSGILCALHLSQPALVSISPNFTRGGVVGAFESSAISPVFIGGPVGPSISSASIKDGILSIYFHGGELQEGPTPDGPWLDTGNTSGVYQASIGKGPMRFYRVRVFSNL